MTEETLHSRIDRAVMLIRWAQCDLGELSDGQRRDLLMDNTDWASDDIRIIVNRAEVAFPEGVEQ